jgi:hypothetical protein
MATAPSAGGWLLVRIWPINARSLAAGAALLLHRFRSKLLRAISVPDDYLAIAATCGLLTTARAFALLSRHPAPLLVCTSLLPIYMLLGKLRHAVFFAVARADYGWRLGYRSVYPPAPVPSEYRSN